MNDESKMIAILFIPATPQQITKPFKVVTQVISNCFGESGMPKSTECAKRLLMWRQESPT
jgi:hypothetical protein